MRRSPLVWDERRLGSTSERLPPGADTRLQVSTRSRGWNRPQFYGRDVEAICPQRLPCVVYNSTSIVSICISSKEAGRGEKDNPRL
jgi:hypothetical protein